MEQIKPQHGGKRPGAGRKKGPERMTFSVDLEKSKLVILRKKYGKSLHSIVKKYLESL